MSEEKKLPLPPGVTEEPREDQIADMGYWLDEEGDSPPNRRDDTILECIEEQYPGGVKEWLFHNG